MTRRPRTERWRSCFLPRPRFPKIFGTDEYRANCADMAGIVLGVGAARAPACREGHDRWLTRPASTAAIETLRIRRAALLHRHVRAPDLRARPRNGRNLCRLHPGRVRASRPGPARPDRLHAGAARRRSDTHRSPHPHRPMHLARQRPFRSRRTGQRLADPPHPGRRRARSGAVPRAYPGSCPRLRGSGPLSLSLGRASARAWARAPAAWAARASRRISGDWIPWTTFARPIPGPSTPKAS